MIGKITKRSFIRGLMKIDVKPERKEINKALTYFGRDCTLYNQMASAMGMISELR